MDNQQKFECWLKNAKADLKTADSTFNGGDWFYILLHGNRLW
jgi:HEPN domain-containing protein